MHAAAAQGVYIRVPVRTSETNHLCTWIYIYIKNFLYMVYGNDSEHVVHVVKVQMHTVAQRFFRED